MTGTAALPPIDVDDLTPVRRGESTRIHLAYRRIDGEFAVLCGGADGRGVHKTANRVTCRRCTAARGDLTTRNAHADAEPAAQAKPLAAYVEHRARQTEVVELRTPRSGPLEGVTTVTRRDTGAVIGTVRRSATGASWFPTPATPTTGRSSAYSDRQQAVGALIDRAVADEQAAARLTYAELVAAGALVPLCPCGKDASHLDADEESSEWACLVPDPDKVPAPRFVVGDRVRDLPADRTGDVVGVSHGKPSTGEPGGVIVRVTWDGDDLDGFYSQDYLVRLDEDVLDDAEDEQATQVREFARQQVVGLGIDAAEAPYPASTFAADVDRLNALRAASGLPRRKGHPGPARRTTSLRFTEAQYAALDVAVRSGYADGRNAVLARLIDEHLTNAVVTAVERA